MENNENNENVAIGQKKYTRETIIKCLGLSAIGAILFLMPMSYEGKLTLPVGILTQWLTEVLTPIMPTFVKICIIISAIGSLVYAFAKPKVMRENELLKECFETTPFWYVLRVAAGIIVTMIALNVGPEWIIGDDTGNYVLTEFLNSFISTIFVGGALMTLLLDFGIMDFVGALFSRFFRFLYHLPGYAAVDCLTSWLGTAVVGVLMTKDRYEKGFYSAREAAIITTTFSACAIPFVIVINATLGLEDYFFEFFYINLITGFLVAIVMVRIPPLSWKKDTYLVDEPSAHVEKPKELSYLKFAACMALDRAETSRFSVKNLIVTGARMIVVVGITTMPIVLVLGTACLALQAYTPVFTWLGMPFIPLLNLLQVPEASAASGCIMAGFGDNFVPAIIASATVVSEYTKFIVGVLSINQLIYVSEVGALIIGAKVSINLLDLFVIFIERTVFCLIVIVCLTNLFGVF
ncbi:MAG: YjiH family protein [Lachnospiraceae bacterium]|nr:YjiH family protein [Lachnospiraceae bacterium]